MEQLIHLNSIPSLKRIALVQVSGDFWNSEIPQMLKRGYLDAELDLWNMITLETAKEKVPSMPVPEDLREELLKFIKLMANTVWYWWYEFRDRVTVREFYLHTICWTQQGLINQQKTMELLLLEDQQQQTLGIAKQFELARIYCVEDCVKTLFKKLNISQIKSLEEVFLYYKDEWQILYRKAASFKDDISLVDRLFLCPLHSYCGAFTHAALRARTVGTKYFLQKLSPADAETHLVQTAIEVSKKNLLYSSHVVCFLFSQMNGTQQLETLKRAPAAILKCFCIWPCNSYFRQVANLMWDFITESDFYEVLLHYLSMRPKMLLSDFDFENIFIEFWLQSPPSHRKYVTNDNIRFSYVLLNLVRLGEMQNMRVLLDSATADEKQNMILSNGGKIMCRSVDYPTNAAYLTILLKECFHSEQELQDFRWEMATLDWTFYTDETDSQDDYDVDSDDEMVIYCNKWREIVDPILKEKFNVDV